MNADEPTPDRFEVSRLIDASPSDVFALLCDPRGHVVIDSSGMLQSATGEAVGGVGDTFVVHMDREALGDYDLGRYDVTVEIVTFEADREIAWQVHGRIKPPLDHVYGYRLEPVPDSRTRVVSYYDWSGISQHWRDSAIFPVLSASALRATLGILDRNVRRGTAQRLV